MNIHQFSFPTQIYFGFGVRTLLADLLKKENLISPLIVTDRGVAKLPFLTEIEGNLKTRGLRVSVFSDISGNPVESQVMAGVQAFKENKSDSIVGLGGGAALDVAKAIALMSTHSGRIFDYEDGKLDSQAIYNSIPHWIALPTTSGTGSEVGRSTVISDEKTHIKKIIFSPKLLAKTVLADPELTLDIPAPITAATGMDALTHCVESYLAKGYHPICDGIALEGFRLAAQNLTTCVKDPKNREAREAMMMASLMGAIAFQKGLGLTHSCAHALSTVADLHHGLANALMIDRTLPFNILVSSDRIKRMAQVIGLSNPSGETFIHWLKDLKSDIGIPHHLSEVGIKEGQINLLAATAFKDTCHQSNPRSCTQEDFERIFTEGM